MFAFHTVVLLSREMSPWPSSSLRDRCRRRSLWRLPFVCIMEQHTHTQLTKGTGALPEVVAS